MKGIKIFAPATVANVSCGFDALGIALKNHGDEMIFSKTDNREIRITKISGADLPYDLDNNLVGTVIKEMLAEHQIDFGLDIEIHKGFLPGSGLGSSAASAAGTAYAINELLGQPYSKLELVKFAMLGEEAACGTPIADNVTAAIFGGFVLIRSVKPLDVVPLNVPDELMLTALHPNVEIRTEDARNVLPKQVLLKDAVIQWANVGGLIAGLYKNDYSLISRSLKDVLVEPHRKKLIPHFDHVKKAALKAEALGAGISGSGPTIFALSKGQTSASRVLKAMRFFYDETGIEFSIFNSKISTQGVKTLESY